MDKQVFLGDGVVTGMHCRWPYCLCFCQDFTVLGGSLWKPLREKICKIMDLAMKNGAPVVG